MEVPRPARAKKGFGQHFLVNAGVVARIVDAACAPPLPVSLVEIGPGTGVLTRPLLARCTTMTAIEADRDLLPSLAALPGLQLVHGSALDWAPQRLAQERGLALPLRGVSNLPYNVGTAILRSWLSQSRAWDRLVFMFQAEVAGQILAGPGPACGPLSVLAQLYARPRRLMDVAPGSFSPPPKVRSTVLVFDPAPDQDPPAYDGMESFLFNAFANRRKKLAPRMKPAARRLLADAGLADARAEAVPFTLWPDLLRVTAD